MARKSLLSNVKNSMTLFLVSSVATAAVGCKVVPPKVDPCAILPDLLWCHATPINQPDKPAYDRPVEEGDICVTPDEYAALQKFLREIKRQCGDRCG